MSKYKVTLKDIRAESPCEDGWVKLLKHLGVSAAEAKADTTPIDLETVLESNGFDDCMWCFCTLPKEHDNAVRLLICDFAERAMKYVTDGENRPQQAIDVARKYANGEATKEELDAARAAARDAAGAATGAATWAATGAAAGAAARDAEISWQEKTLQEWLAK